MSETFKTLVKELGNENDAQIGASIISTLLESSRELDFGLDIAMHSDAFVLRVRRLIRLTDADVRRIANVSERIVDIDVFPASYKIHVTVRRCNSVVKTQPRTRTTYVPVGVDERRQRTRDPGWEATGIVDSDDCAHLDAIIGDVCDMHSIMPVVRTWLELIDSRKAAIGEATLPRGNDVDESESETNALVRADDPACVGFALCFVNVPTFSAFFFDYLRETHGVFVTRTCLWFGCATLVVNVRKMSAANVSATTLNSSHQLKGDPLRKRKTISPARASKKAKS